MSDSKTTSHVCVLCNAKLGSKEALQEHFRKHANREIDGKGRPRKAKVPGGIVTNGPKKTASPAPPPNLQRVNLPSNPVSNDVTSAAVDAATAAPAAPGSSPSSSSCKTVTQNNATVTGGAKSPGKPSTGIVCDVCGQEFETVTIAIQHKFKKHPDSAIKHFCPHCGQQFPLKINRDKHLQIHPSAPPSQLFPCQECGVVFYNAQAQSYHFKSTHKRIVAIFKPVETPPPSKKIRMNNAGEAQSVYYCHICGYEYIIKFNLQKHIERHHPEKERNAIPEGIIKCTTCDALFYSKKAYDNHNMYHRPDDLYVTSEEQRLQTVSRVDQDFDIRRVQPGPDKFIPVNRPRPVRSNMSLAKAETKKSLRRFKGKRNKPQKTRRKAGLQPKEGSSDETDESDTSSESELSPDSGPDSDSDSDVPLQASVKQDVGKSCTSQAVVEAKEKKVKGTKRDAVECPSPGSKKKKKTKEEVKQQVESSGSGGEGEQAEKAAGGCDGHPQCTHESTSGGNDSNNGDEMAVVDETKPKVMNGGEEEVGNAKGGLEGGGDSLRKPQGRAGGRGGAANRKGRSGKGSAPSGAQGEGDQLSGAKGGTTASRRVDVLSNKTLPSEENRDFKSDSSPQKKICGSSKKQAMSEDTDDRSS